MICVDAPLRILQHVLAPMTPSHLALAMPNLVYSVVIPREPVGSRISVSPVFLLFIFWSMLRPNNRLNIALKTKGVSGLLSYFKDAFGKTFPIVWNKDRVDSTMK